MDIVKPPLAASAAPRSLILTTTWEREDNPHFCGPASARIALSALLASPPTQADIGAFLDWDHLGNCDTEVCPDDVRDLAHVAAALDHYLDTDRYEPTYLSDPPTDEEQAELARRVVDGITAGFPLVAFVYGPGSDEPFAFCPPFYPADGPPHHFITVIGYEDGGAAAVISDSASGDDERDRWGDFPETYSIPIADFAKWIGYHGYAG
ncbi:MAG TPA: C39 family peptidase [Byssovorax sp.]